MLKCRLIGALLAKQTAAKKTIRNDRYFFVSEKSIAFEHIDKKGDFTKPHNEQPEDFLSIIIKPEDKKFEPLKFTNATKAKALLGKKLHDLAPLLLHLLNRRLKNNRRVKWRKETYFPSYIKK